MTQLLDGSQMEVNNMALDYRKAIRNLALVAGLIIVPVILMVMQCCNPVFDDTKSPITVSSFRVWRVAEKGYKSGNGPVYIHGSHNHTDHIQKATANTANIQLQRRNEVSDIGINVISESNNADYVEANYTDLDYKIVHNLDIEESESHAYYKRKAVLQLRRPSTTHKPDKPLSGPVDCSLLLQADHDEIQRASQKLQLKQHIDTEQDILHLTKNCQAYIKKREYVTSVLSSVEAEFPLAFGIRMHDRVAQAEMLLRAIYRPNNIYCLYIDKKSPQKIHDTMTGVANCFPNVFIASELKRYVYTSFSPVQADLQCMQDIVATGAQWKYFLNLAGTEFPLKTNREIVEILKTLNGSNDIEQYPFPKEFYHRFSWRHLVVEDTLINTNEPKVQFNGNVTIQKGCSYNSYSRPFVEWILGNELAQRFINWTKDVDSPDEIVWASLNHLPQAPGGYAFMVTQTAKTFLSREVIWYSSAAYCHSSRRVRGICIFSVGDLQWLSRRWELFANKFDINFDHYALDCLEESLNNRTLHPDPDRDISWYGIYRAPHVTIEPSPERKRFI